MKMRMDFENWSLIIEQNTMSIEAPIVNLEKGQKLGKWKILKKLDEGGFGSVFKVTE